MAVTFKKPPTFTFREVLRDAGLMEQSEAFGKGFNWSFGRALQKRMRYLGDNGTPILTKKTSKNPSVKAPHCIQHYDRANYKQALEFAHWWYYGYLERQMKKDGDFL